MAKETKKVNNKEEKKVSKPTTSRKEATTKKVDKSKVKEETKKVNKTSTNKSKSTAPALKKSTNNTATSQKKPTRTTSNKNTKKASTRANTSKTKSTTKPMLAEYYDLPYRYNETTVKILAQTPTTLFVYWDISDDDRNVLLEKHGDNMFYETKPILIVHNLTKNYSFEIEINDFANSWYIRTQEPDCDYIVELGRRIINKPEEYIYIHSSNDIISPNNHILFEQANLGNVLFRNVKTHVLSSRAFGSLQFINNMDKLYGNIYDVYSRLYREETLNELGNPSSGEFIR